MKVDADANVGIGTQTPTAKLEVIGSGGLSPLAAIHGESDRPHGAGVAGTNTSSGNGVSGYNTSTGNGVYGSSVGGYAGYFDGNVKVDGRVTSYRGFPRPDFDTGWYPILPGASATFTHGLGGDVNNYFVDLQFKSDMSVWV